MHYNPYVEPKLVVTVNVTSTTRVTKVMANTAVSLFTEIEIDGVIQQSIATGYTFDTAGMHTVTYKLANPTEIGAGAFNSCGNFKSVTIPDNVTSIGASAFYSCTGLTTMNIPAGVTELGDSFVRRSSGLTSITFEATTPPTLGGGSSTIAFDSTNNCPIYVPTESVDTYKAAIGWSNYASVIEAIA